MDTAQRMRAVDKAARRKMNHKARKDGLGLEGVITTLTTQLREVKAQEVDSLALYHTAKRQMGERIHLGALAKAGDVQAGKRRRKLNDWEIDTKPAGPSDAWAPEGGRKAVGRCDVDAVQSLNKAKRGY